MANAVGNLISETYGDSLNTFEYELDQSISSYLVGIHCGPYERVESSFQGVERIIPVEYYAKASDTSKMKIHLVTLCMHLIFMKKILDLIPLIK